MKDRIADASPLSRAGLRQSDFVQIADEGLGDGLNSYAHSMYWFQDHLYLGTTRANLCSLKVNNPTPMRCWPVKCPEDVYDLDRRAQIWRYSPHTAQWQRVFRAPLVTGVDDSKVPREIGYRAMAAFQGRSDPIPALYVCTWSPARTGRPSLVIRSRDGHSFQSASRPKADPSLNTFRILLPVDGKLYTSPTGRSLGWQGSIPQTVRVNTSGAPVVLESEDPTRKGWRAVSLSGFGDENNLTLFDMASFAGHLYAGTLNGTKGFQLWKAKPEGPPPYHWQPVLTDGAFRGNLNESVVSLCAFGGALYVGTGIQNGGYDRAYKVGPAGAEVLRVYPDDHWDLIVGSARMTSDGFKAPLSGLGPGFDNFFNTYLWRMVVHDGWLYASTYNWSVFLRYLAPERWPAWVRKLVGEIGSEDLLQKYGGFDLWRTRDGVKWVPVTTTGFNNPYNFGARTLVSSPAGLFVGTANPFGPEVAVHTLSGWRYVPNPKGGLEVWLGARPEPGRNDGGSYSLALWKRPSRPLLNDSVERYHERDTTYGKWVAEYYGQSDFANCGLWTWDTRSQKEACENLMQELLRLLPSGPCRILDVACGRGATTHYLMAHHDAAEITGVTPTLRHLEVARRKAPDCAFLAMDGTRLSFSDAHFDAVLCVEGAFRFDTRADFLKEALRVLRPGGRLVMTDVLFGSRAVEGISPYRSAENYVGSLRRYKELLSCQGFREIEVVDATEECWRPFQRECGRFALGKFLLGEIDRRTLRRIRVAGLHGLEAVRHYILVDARKPGKKRPVL